MKLFFNRPLKLLLMTNFLVLFAAAMIGPIYAIFVEKIGGDLLDASFAGAALAFAAGITVLVFGRFSDKAKESELIIVAGYIIMGIGFILYLFVNSVWFLLVVQVIIGLGEAIYTPAFNVLYTRHINKRQSGIQWGAWESINYFTLGLSAIIGGFVVTKLGFSAVFVIMSLLCFGSAIYIFFLPRKVL